MEGGSDPEQKTDGKVGLHVGSDSGNDVSTTKDNDADNGDDMNGAETEPYAATTRPNQMCPMGIQVWLSPLVMKH